LNTETKIVLVEAYNSVGGKIERYYDPFKRIYSISIFKEELASKNIDKHIILQIAFKAINNIAGLSDIILILFVYDAYPRLFKTDFLAFFITKRRKAFRVATKEIRRL
jgi:hypothetical protein